MAKYNATHVIVCAVQVRGKFNNKTNMFDVVACGTRIRGRGTSEISEQAAKDAAEFQAQGKLAGHMRRKH